MVQILVLGEGMKSLVLLVAEIWNSNAKMTLVLLSVVIIQYTNELK